MIWKIIIVLSASIAGYFIPTPQDLKNAFVGGQNFYASSNFIKAIQQYDQIISTDSDFLNEDSVKVDLLDGEFRVSVVVAALYQKANAFKNLGKKNEAVEYFKVVENRQDEPELAALAQFQIYDIYYRSAQFDSAISEARKLVDKYPQNKKAETALYDIGWAYKELDTLEKSNETFQELLTKYPATDYLPRAIYQLGQNNYDQKNYDQAISYWTELNAKFKPEAFQDKDWENVQLKSVKERQIFEATAGRETDETVLELVAKSQVKIGDAYREKGDYETAQASYKKVVTIYSLLPILVEVSYVKMSDYALQEKGIGEAVQVYQSAIDENFANKELQAKMQYKIAEAYQNQKVFDKAAVEYRFYIKAYSDVADLIEFSSDKAQYSVVAMLYNAKKYDEAVSEADTLIKNYQYSEAVPGVLFLKGLSLNELGRYSEARGAFTAIANQYSDSPDFVNAKVQIGFTLFQEGKYEESLDSYEEVLNKYPDQIDSSQVFFDLINVYYELKRYDEALASFYNVKFGSQYFTAAFGKVTKIYGLRGEYEQGENFLNNILEQGEKADSIYYTADINFAFADLNISKNDYNTAAAYLTKVIKDTVLSQNRTALKLQSYYARGVLNYQLENYPASVSDLEFVLNSSEFNQRFSQYLRNVNEKLALAYSKTGKKNEALAMINQLIEKTSDETEKGSLYSIISNIYFEADDFRKAIETANNLLKLDRVDEASKVSSYITIAQSYKKLNELNKAASYLLEAGEKFPNASEIPAVLYSLGALYFDTQEYEKSADIFNKFISRYSDDAAAKEAKYFRAYSYYESGNWRQAYNSFKQYAAAYPEDPLSIECQYYAAEALFNQKDFNSAIRDYRLTYQKYPSSDFAPLAMYNEGWSYFELNEPEKMVETFKRLAERFPKSSYAGDGLFTIGDYYYNKKDYLNASDAYSELLNKFPNYDKAEEAKNLVHDLSQINSYLEYEQAMKYFDARNYPKTIEELTRLLQKYPDASIAVGCQVNIAASYEMLDDYRTAAVWYKKIISNYSDSKDDNERGAVFFAKEHLEWIESNF